MNHSSHLHFTHVISMGVMLSLLILAHTASALLRVAGDRTEQVNVEQRSTPTVIGHIERTAKHIEYLQESSHTQTFRYPGASYVKLHLRRFDLPAGDFITISNPSGSEQYTYPGDPITTDEQAGFWALSINGDTAIVELHIHSGLDNHKAQFVGIEIDQVARGYSEAELFEEISWQESTCGSNQRQDVACYQQSHPTEYHQSQAVAKIMFNDLENDNQPSVCTAWRVGPDNHLITNQHCIGSQEELETSEIWFNYQRTECAGDQIATVTKVTGYQLLLAHVNLDFALFTVNNFDTIAQLGYLELDARTPVVNEEIYIPQHGSGNPKQFGIESDQDSDNLCRIQQAIVDGIALETDTSYLCDTIGGSSGSPVLARQTHKVIALHHFGGCPNQGVLIERIWPYIQPYLEGSVVTFSSHQYTIAENEGSIQIPVNYFGKNQNFVSVDYSVNGGNAVQDLDYSLPSIQTLTWENETTKFFTINIFDNKLEDNYRTIELSLTNLTGVVSGIHETTTVTITDDEILKFCHQPTTPLLIPYDDKNDNQKVQLTDTLTIDEDFPIGDLNVAIQTTHSWVGDLSYSLRHVETGTEVTLIQGPNYGEGNCSGDNIDVVLDDEAELNIQDQCDSPTAYSETYYQPAGSLADFDYQMLKGDWVLTAWDSYSQDEGHLVQWCLLPEKGDHVQLKAVNQPQPVCPGDTVEVSFQLTIPEAIAATQVELRFDPVQLQAIDVVNSGTLHFLLDQQPPNNSEGYLKFTAAHFGDSPPAGSTFELFTVTFKALVESQNTQLYFEPNNTFTVSSEGNKLAQISQPVDLQLMCQPEFQVQLQGQAPASSGQIPLSIHIAGVGDYENVMAENGQGKLPKALASGDYVACVKGPSSLQKRINFTMPNKLVDFGVLQKGDIDDDNEVDLWDFILMYLNRNTCDDGVNYWPPANLNGDQCIDIADAELLKDNFGLVGDTCEPVTDVEATARRRGPTQLKLLPPATVTIGQQLEIPIQVQSDSSNPVSAAMAHLNFDPGLLQVNAIEPGSQLDFTLQNHFDNDQGQIDVVAVLWSNEPVSEPFILATLKVTVLQNGGAESLALVQPTQAVTLNQTAATEQHLTAVAPASCQLYGVSHEDGQSQLFTIGLTDNYPLNHLSNVYPEQHITALAIERTQDQIYAVATLPYTQETGLYRVDGQSGLLSLVGKIGYTQITDLSFNAEGRLWGWAEAGLITIDPQSGKGALVLPAYSKDIKVAGLTLSQDKNALFFGITGRDLWQYDMETEALTLACNNLNHTAQSLEMIIGDLLLFGNQHDKTFELTVFNAQTCAPLMTLPIAGVNQVESIALPTSACAQLF